jgi:hypothetical protein
VIREADFREPEVMVLVGLINVLAAPLVAHLLK